MILGYLGNVTVLLEVMQISVTTLYHKNVFVWLRHCDSKHGYITTRGINMNNLVVTN